MAKRPSKHLRPASPLSGGHASAAVKRDGRFLVRTVPGSRATKTYTCPGCHRQILPGTPHMVTWPAEPTFGAGTTSGLEERRHWHTGCWTRRP